MPGGDIHVPTKGDGWYAEGITGTVSQKYLGIKMLTGRILRLVGTRLVQ